MCQNIKMHGPYRVKISEDRIYMKRFMGNANIFCNQNTVYKVTFKSFKNISTEYYTVLCPCCETKFH